MEEGRVLGLIGINGAEKHAYECVVVEKPDGGTIELDGKEMIFHSRVMPTMQALHFIHQEPQYFHMTVAENIFISDLYMKNKVFTDKKKMMEERENTFRSLHQY